MRTALVLITTIYLLRGLVLVPALIARGARPLRFVIWSSLIVLITASSMRSAPGRPGRPYRQEAETMATPYRYNLQQTGGPEVLEAEEMDLPKPGEGEVLIRHEAVGLNYIDTYHGRFLPASLASGLARKQLALWRPSALGSPPSAKGSGWATSPVRWALISTHRTIAEDRLVKLPDGVSSEVAAAALLKGCTAEFLVERCASISKPERRFSSMQQRARVGSILVQWLNRSVQS
jgi:hypothetical protein